MQCIDRLSQWWPQQDLVTFDFTGDHVVSFHLPVPSSVHALKSEFRSTRRNTNLTSSGTTEKRLFTKVFRPNLFPVGPVHYTKFRLAKEV